MVDRPDRTILASALHASALEGAETKGCPVPPITLVLAAVLVATPLAAAAQPILGDWRTEDGETISIRRCGKAFCSTVATGAYRGRSVGTVGGPGPVYRGKIIDPRDGKSWTGSMTVKARRLAVEGCLMEVFCKTVQTWTRR